MKKRLFAMFLALCAVVLVGCGNVNPNIKLSSISCSASEFFGKAKDEIALLGNFGRVYGSAENNTDYMIIYSLIFSESMITYNAVSAIDFCIEIEESQTTVGLEQKIYEYETSYEEYGLSGKVLVHVGKVVGKSNAFECSQYYVDKTVDYSEIVEKGSEPQATNTFTITKDRSSGKYTFTDLQSSVQGQFMFENKTGQMSMELSYVADVFGKKNFETKIDLYNYTNDVVGTRIITKTTMDNQKVEYIFESISADFSKRSKMGVVKDGALYLDMSGIKEENIAVVNSGDSYVYTTKYSNVSEAELFSVVVEKEGLQN